MTFLNTNRFKYIVIILITVAFHSCKSDKNIETKDSRNSSIDVILMGGQSNMVGQGKLADINIKMYENQTYFDFGLTSKMKKTVGNFGPEVGVAEILHREAPDKKFILIKYGIGGSSMFDWAPNYSIERAKITGKPEFGNMYATLLKKVDSITSGLDTRIVSLLWMQGERDARVPEAGKEYYDNFQRFIEAIRKDTKNPDLPIIFGKINPPQSRFTLVDSVAAAQKRISENIKNMILVSTDGLSKKKDSVHYDSNGQLELGRRMGESLIKVMQ